VNSKNGYLLKHPGILLALSTCSPTRAFLEKIEKLKSSKSYLVMIKATAVLVIWPAHAARYPAAKKKSFL
jgi:hypothetical protein